MVEVHNNMSDRRRQRSRNQASCSLPASRIMASYRQYQFFKWVRPVTGIFKRCCKKIRAARINNRGCTPVLQLPYFFPIMTNLLIVQVERLNLLSLLLRLFARSAVTTATFLVSGPPSTTGTSKETPTKKALSASTAVLLVGTVASIEAGDTGHISWLWWPAVASVYPTGGGRFRSRVVISCFRTSNFILMQLKSVS